MTYDHKADYRKNEQLCTPALQVIQRGIVPVYPITDQLLMRILYR